MGSKYPRYFQRVYLQLFPILLTSVHTRLLVAIQVKTDEDTKPFPEHFISPPSLSSFDTTLELSAVSNCIYKFSIDLHCAFQIRVHFECVQLLLFSCHVLDGD